MKLTCIHLDKRHLFNWTTGSQIFFTLVEKGSTVATNAKNHFQKLQYGMFLKYIYKENMELHINL
jgi:hypothetical protein